MQHILEEMEATAAFPFTFQQVSERTHTLAVSRVSGLPQWRAVSGRKTQIPGAIRLCPSESELLLIDTFDPQRSSRQSSHVEFFQQRVVFIDPVKPRIAVFTQHRV